MRDWLMRLLFVSLYLGVDLAYVFLSRPVYEQVARNIQGSGFPRFTRSRVMGALLAYGSMALAWALLVAPTARAWVHHAPHLPAWMSGAAAGALYGLVLYGVFNGTLHVMFEKYDLKIFARDMAWGITWSATLTALYANVATKYITKL